MNLFHTGLLVIALLPPSAEVFAQPASASPRAGYGTVQGWKDTSSIIKEPWAQGFIDGLLVANYTSNPQGDTEWLTSCLRGMKMNQIVAIFDKYVAANPAEWHKPMSLAALAALKSTCKK